MSKNSSETIIKPRMKVFALPFLKNKNQPTAKIEVKSDQPNTSSILNPSEKYKNEMIRTAATCHKTNRMVAKFGWLIFIF